MARGDIQVGDIGTIFRFTVRDNNNAVVDLSGATTKNIILLRPDGRKLTVASSFTNSGTDGQIQYAVVSGDLDIGGMWRAQVYVVVNSKTYYSDKIQFKVHDNL